MDNESYLAAIRALTDEAIIKSGILLLNGKLEILGKRLIVLSGEEKNTETDIEIKSTEDEIKYLAQQQDAYLDAEFKVLQDNNSRLLKSSKIIKAFINSDETHKEAAQRKLRRYLLKLLLIYANDSDIDQEKTGFFDYIENHCNKKNEKKKVSKDAVKIIYSSSMVESMEEETATIENEETTTDNNEHVKKIIHELLSADEIHALNLYYQQFKELDSRNITTKLKNSPSFIEELSPYTRSLTAEGATLFLECAMDTIEEVKEMLLCH